MRIIAYSVNYINYFDYSNDSNYSFLLQSFQTSLLRLSSNHCRIHLTYLHLPSDSLNMQAGSAQGPPFAL